LPYSNTNRGQFGNPHGPDEAGDPVGRVRGRQVAAQAWEKAQSYWNGIAGE